MYIKPPTFEKAMAQIKSNPVKDAKTIYLTGEDISLDKFDSVADALKAWIEPKEKLEELI